MPTGYTAAIAKGITFEQYALSCAHAFGALVMMRDEPLDAPIPEFQPQTEHNEKALKKATERLAELKAMKPAAMKKAHAEAFAITLANTQEYLRDKIALKAKYEAMKAQAESWVPPTEDHKGLRKFMVEQIVESIDFDCDGSYHTESFMKSVIETPKEWKAMMMEAAKSDIAYHTKKIAEEIARTAQRNEWVKQLRDSLKKD